MVADNGSSRRRFLKTAGFGLSALCLRLGEAQRAFADDLDAVPPSEGAEHPFATLRQQYTLAEGVTYLNHASIGTMPRAVQKAQRRYLELCESNPWLHMWGEAWVEPIAAVRRRAAAELACRAEEITFSHNTTETFNLLAQGLPLGPGDEVLFASTNHSGASVCWHHMAEARGYRVRRFDFPLLETPGLSEDDVVAIYAEAIGPDTRVLVLPHIDNLVGLCHPIRRIAEQARERGVRFVAVDAAQSVGMLPVEVGSLGVDVYATSAHKWLQAPKGLGLAYVAESVQPHLRPMWVTWGQKSWHETARKYEDYGTRNLAEVLTLGDALQFRAELGGPQLEAHHQRLRSFARQKVEAEPRLHWHSPRQWSLGSALYLIGIEGVDAAELFRRLFDSHGFVWRPFTVHGLNAVRISPNAFNSEAELERLLDLLVATTRA